jgi:hypothetical protein
MIIQKNLKIILLAALSLNSCSAFWVAEAPKLICDSVEIVACIQADKNIKKCDEKKIRRRNNTK